MKIREDQSAPMFIVSTTDLGALGWRWMACIVDVGIGKGDGRKGRFTERRSLWSIMGALGTLARMERRTVLRATWEDRDMTRNKVF